MNNIKRHIAELGNSPIFGRTLDFSVKPNILPLTGTTWAVANGKAFNTPGHGANLVDALASTFDSGVGGWTAYGTNAVENDNGELRITGNGSSTQGGYVYLRNSTILSGDLTIGKVYRIEVDARVNAGSDVSLSASDGTNSHPFHITNTSPVTYHITFRALHATNCLLNFSGFGNGEICWLDNLKLYQLNDADLTAYVNLGFNPTTFVLKSPTIVATGGAIGVRFANTAAGITNSLTSYYDKNRGRIVTGQFLAGVWSEIAAATAVATYVIGGVVELFRLDATTFRVKYNNTQVGTDFTVDAAIAAGTYFGLYSTEEGSTASSFFCGQTVTSRSVVYLGDSIMDGSSASSFELTSYRALTKFNLDAHYGNADITHFNGGVGGTDSWYALIRFAADVVAKNPDLIIIEFVNDTNVALSKSCEEALFRKIRTQLPNAKVVFLALPTITSNAGNDATNSKATTIANWLTLCALYGVAIADWTGVSKALIDAGTYTCAQVWYDDKHLLDLGHSLAAAFLKPYVCSGILHDGAQFSGNLPARIYDTGAKEAAPIIRNAIDNDGETGTWSTVATTARQSTVADSTIQWTGTFSSFGLDGLRQVGSLSWQIDGGEWHVMDGNVNLGYPLNLWNSDVAAEHTVTVKVNSGTVRINRFLGL